MPKKTDRALAILREASEDAIAQAKADLELKQIKQRQTIAELRREVRAMALQIGVQDDQIAAYEALSEQAVLAKPAKFKKVRRRKGEAKPVAVVLGWSDWHTHELVDIGSNPHDPDIGKARAHVCVGRSIEMIELLQKRARVETIVVWLGGDFMTNAQMPHYDALRSVGLSPVDEAMGCRDLLAECLGRLREAFPETRIHVTTSWGNHERTTPKMEPGIAKDFTYANLIYRDLARLFEPDELTTFTVAEDEVTITDLHGFRLATHHGHQIKYSDAIGGIATATNKFMLKLFKQDIYFDALLIGHWHRIGMEAGTRAFTNGSLVGINRYAKNLNLGDEPPAQTGIVIDLERRAVADWWRIWGV